MSTVSRARSRQPEGLATGGQFATEVKSELEGVSLSPAAAPTTEEPTDLRSALVVGHRRLTDEGMSHQNATAFLVATASQQLASQYLEHGKTAAERGQEGAALGYIQAHRAVSGVLKSATANVEDPEALAADVAKAQSDLRPMSEMFQGFGPNPVSQITGETDQFLSDVQGFMGDVREG